MIPCDASILALKLWTFLYGLSATGFEILQVAWDKREELLIKAGLDPKKDLLNLTLRYNVSLSCPSSDWDLRELGAELQIYHIATFRQPSINILDWIGICLPVWYIQL